MREQENEAVTPLHLAVYHEDVELVKKLLECQVVDPNAANNSGVTPLHLAAWRNNEKITELLLNHERINPFVVNANGVSPLQLAVKFRSTGVAKLLAQCILRMRPLSWEEEYKICESLIFRAKRDLGGSKMLHWAVEYGVMQVAGLLLEHKGASLIVTNAKGRTPFQSAVCSRQTQLIKLLSQHELLDVNRELFWAVRNGHAQAVKLLLKRKDIDPNTTDSNGKTPLFLAIEKGDERIAKILLEHKYTDPSMACDSNTPLNMAEWCSNMELINLLLADKRLDINKELILAAGSGNLELVKTLLAQKVIDPNATDSDGDTPLIRAIEKRHTQIAKLLLENSETKYNLTDAEGTSPLHLAACLGLVQVVAVLLEKDINPSVLTADGRTPLRLAACCHKEQVVRLLSRDERLDVDKELSFAKEWGREEIVHLLLKRNSTSCDKNCYNSSNRERAPLHLRSARKAADSNISEPGPIELEDLSCMSGNKFRAA